MQKEVGTFHRESSIPGAAGSPFLFRAARRTLHKLRSAGLRETAAVVRKNFALAGRIALNRCFDWRYHIDTAGVIQLADLTCESGNRKWGVWYEPTPLRALTLMLSVLPADVSNFTFVDFGSGKGRTLLYASTRAFRRILGVEFTLELHQVAERNIRTYRNPKQRCFDITSLHTDAVEFAMPEEPCVLYFFHPFGEEVMARVLANIRNSYQRHPRKFILLYYHPQLRHMLEGMEFLRKCDERVMPFDLSGEPCIYRRRLEVYETVEPRSDWAEAR
jgi:hypothetical protein